MSAGSPEFFFNHSKDISEVTTLNPWSSNPNLLTTFDLPLPAPPAKNITFLFGFGEPSGFGILALTPDLVKPNVSSKSKTDKPLALPVLLNLILLLTALLKFLAAFISVDGFENLILPLLFILKSSAIDASVCILTKLSTFIPPSISAINSLKYLSHQLFSKTFHLPATFLPSTISIAIKFL